MCLRLPTYIYFARYFETLSSAVFESTGYLLELYGCIPCNNLAKNY